MVIEKQIIGYKILKAKNDSSDPDKIKPERFMFYTVEQSKFAKGFIYDDGSHGNFNNNIYYLPTCLFENKDDILSLDGFDFFRKVILLVIDQPFGSKECSYSIKLLDFKK